MPIPVDKAAANYMARDGLWDNSPLFGRPRKAGSRRDRHDVAPERQPEPRLTS
jgi:hypothetical protein